MARLSIRLIASHPPYSRHRARKKSVPRVKQITTRLLRRPRVSKFKPRETQEENQHLGPKCHRFPFWFLTTKLGYPQNKDEAIRTSWGFLKIGLEPLFSDAKGSRFREPPCLEKHPFGCGSEIGTQNGTLIFWNQGLKPAVP